MARVIEERWMGIGWDVITEHLPVADEQGRPVHDAHGAPKTAEHVTLVFILAAPGEQRVVRIPFTLERKAELVGKLTGGIVVPAAASPVVAAARG